MDASKLAIEAAAFVLTYAIHSTLLLGVACLVARRVRGLALRERIWKAALVGGVGTALLQSGLAWRTPLVHWTLRANDAGLAARGADEPLSTALVLECDHTPCAPAACVDDAQCVDSAPPCCDQVSASTCVAPSSSAPDPASCEERELVRDPASNHDRLRETRPEVAVASTSAPVAVNIPARPEPSVAHTASAPAPRASASSHRVSSVDTQGSLAGVASPEVDAAPVGANSSSRASDTFTFATTTRLWTLRGLVAWGAFALLALAGFGAMWLRLSRRLRGRRELVEGELRDKLDELIPLAFGRAAKVRLFEAPELLAPLSYGVFRRAICVPPRASVDLAADEQATMLAHELAHLARRDPFWLAVAWWIERVFFFQPLNRVARGELIEIAELACDDWAVRRTGDRLALASCLTRIAGWIVGPARTLASQANFPATSMAGLHGRSCLTRRIERLLDDAPETFEERTQRWAGPAVLAALGSLTLVTPGVCAERTAPGEAAVPPASPRTSRVFESVAAPAKTQLVVALRQAATEASKLLVDVAVQAVDAPTGADEDREAHEADDADEAPGGLAEELAALDEGIDELDAEVEDLRAELGEGEFADSLAPTFDALRARVARLRDRRASLERIASVLAALESERAGPAQTPTTPR